MKLNSISVRCFKVPTATKEEADGTLTWKATTLVTVELGMQGMTGLGYTYADESTAHFIVEHALPILKKSTVTQHHQVIAKIKRNCRNLGNAGVNSMALSAIDTAFWDLRAKFLHTSIQDLLGRKRDVTPFYGSGLFINHSQKDLKEEIEFFHALGMKTLKMKIGSGATEDIRRVKLVREYMKEEDTLYVDANGAYQTKEALTLAHQLTNYGVTWFEEPITSDDTIGMNFLKEHFPPQLNYVAGEYANQLDDFQRLLKNNLVDVMQVDATRCEGVTGALAGATLARAYHIPVSTHCAPLLHGNLGICLDHFMIGECFFDHQRIEEKIFNFEGTFTQGHFSPARDQKGFGWELNPNEREYQIYEHVI